MRISLFYRYTLYILHSFVIAFLCMVVMPVHAQARLITTTPTNVNDPSHITILILDMSGSMASNDPTGLRCSAANAYIDLSGPGQYIGLIGLDNNNGFRVGPHNFQTAQAWASPTEMTTLTDRQRLKQVIASKSNECRPDGSSPTYNALEEALGMLQSATQGNQMSGSVLLLTDGVPDPDTTTQITAITKDLIPQFQHNHWAIDTIALGPDALISPSSTTFHGFLSDLSNSTGGIFYDDGRGPVPGISALNILPFTVDIFAKRIGRTATFDIPPTQTDGGTIERNFSITDFTRNLEVVIAKDQSITDATLRAPNGQVITGSSAGSLFSSSDSHYIIFFIDQPQQGTWQLHVSGSGQFMMSKLTSSTLSLSTPQITMKDSASSDSSVLPLGQQLTITEYLTNNQQQTTNNSFIISASISYVGGIQQYSKNFVLKKTNPGTYVGSVNIPLSAPEGTYNLQVFVSGLNSAAVITSQDQFISMVVFPSPVLQSSQTIVIQWDPLLRFFYGLPVSWIQWLSQWPLQGSQAQPFANLTGEIQLKGKFYNNATVIAAMVTSPSSNNSIQAQVMNDGGRFQVLFPASVNGVYTVTIKSNGSFDGIDGNLSATQDTVFIAIKPASTVQESYAWMVTAFYLMCVVLFGYIIRFYMMSPPFGEWVRKEDGEVVSSHGFKHSHRGFFQWFFLRNVLASQQVGMPAGLQFRFLSRNTIEVRPYGPASAYWRSKDGSELQPQFQVIHELVYHPKNGGDDELSIFIIVPKIGERSILEEIDSATY